MGPTTAASVITEVGENQVMAAAPASRSGLHVVKCCFVTAATVTAATSAMLHRVMSSVQAVAAVLARVVVHEIVPRAHPSPCYRRALLSFSGDIA